MLTSIFTDPITITQLLICLFSSLVAGILLALTYSYKSKSTSSFSLTLAILPFAMCMVVIAINGNLGVAVAVAGGFALVKFRSQPGTGREISAIFIDMTIGVVLGMGYVYVAAIFFVITAVVVLLLTALNFGVNTHEKVIKITIPEDYDYTSLFDDVFEKYHAKAYIERVKTTNMGSLIDVTYRVSMPSNNIPKEMLDDLRVKNANLSIVITSSDYVKKAL